jgi:hypothetical protein
MYMNRSISRVLAAAVASTGFAVPVPTIGASLSCTAASFTAPSDGSGNINVSCTQAGTTGGGTCSIFASPSVLPASGGTVTVSTSCGANTSLSGGKSVAQDGSNSWTDTIGANGLSTTISFTYTVSGDGGTKSVTVSQSGTGGGTTPPPGGPISCAGFAETIVLDLAWGTPNSGGVRAITKGFGNNDIVVARFTTPNTTAANVFASIAAAEYIDQQHQRTATLSRTPCDFPYPNPVGRLATTTQATSSVAFTYAVGGSSTYYAILQPNTTYYLNIKNVAAGVSTCAPGQSCNMAIELQKPNGL